MSSAVLWLTDGESSNTSNTSWWRTAGSKAQIWFLFANLIQVWWYCKWSDLIYVCTHVACAYSRDTNKENTVNCACFCRANSLLIQIITEKWNSLQTARERRQTRRLLSETRYDLDMIEVRYGVLMFSSHCFLQHLWAQRGKLMQGERRTQMQTRIRF